MDSRQRPLTVEALTLHSERLGALPLINHFLDRLGLERQLEIFVPTLDRRVQLPYAKALGVLLRSILIEREPLYRQQETVSTFAPAAFGLDFSQSQRLGDDAVGRALDRLFDADRGALLTAVVVDAVQAFGVALAELHNDSTTVKFCGQYAQARGRRLRGKRAPWITYGYSKNVAPVNMWRQSIRGPPPSRASVRAAHISASARARAGTPSGTASTSDGEPMSADQRCRRWQAPWPSCRDRPRHRRGSCPVIHARAMRGWC